MMDLVLSTPSPRFQCRRIYTEVVLAWSLFLHEASWNRVCKEAVSGWSSKR